MKKIIAPYFSRRLRLFAVIAVLCSGISVSLNAQDIFFVTYKNVTYFCFESMTCSTVDGLKSTGQVVYDIYYDCTALGGGIGEITVYGIAPQTDSGDILPVEPDPFGFYTPPEVSNGGGGGTTNISEEIPQDWFSQPKTINFDKMNQQTILEEMLKWFEWFCENKGLVEPSLGMVIGASQLPMYGLGGNVINGYGTIDGVSIQWQFSYSTYGKNNKLSFDMDDYENVFLCYASDTSERRMVLNFNSSQDKRKVLIRRIPCIGNNLY